MFAAGRCMKLWEFCGVFRHGVLSNFSNIQKSCIHTKFVVTAFQFVLHIAAIEDLGWLGHHNPKSTSVLITLSTCEVMGCHSPKERLP